MDSDIQALELPAFEMDCREWFVAAPQLTEATGEFEGAPVVAVLSTASMSDTALASGRAVFRLGLVDDIDHLGAEDSAMPELVDVDFAAGSARYVIAAPGRALALVAEFDAEGADVELMSRFERLMTSFRWAS
jgi:hypothetical protein